MKALLSKAAGGPDALVLEEVASPVPGPGQVRLRVHACALGYADTLIINDQYQLRPPRPFAPGGEVSGVVDALGEGVTTLKEGDRVIGWCFWGGLAEELVIDADKCVPIPDAMPFDDAAALLFSHGTALYALRERGELKAGETLLVTGASGGVGLAAVELGKAMGARVVAAVSSQEKLELALASGADAGVVYPASGMDKDAARAFGQQLKEALGQQGADVVLDVVGGDYAEQCLRAIAWQGRYLVVGFAAGIPKLPMNLVLLKGCDIRGVGSGEYIAREREKYDASHRELIAMYSKGLNRPRISQRFTLARAGHALSLLTTRKAVGKLVVTMTPSAVIADRDRRDPSNPPQP